MLVEKWEREREGSALHRGLCMCGVFMCCVLYRGLYLSISPIALVIDFMTERSAKRWAGSALYVAKC